MKNWLAFALLFFLSTGNLLAQPSKKPFVITQSMRYKEPLDLSAYGIPRSPIIYESLLLPSKNSDQMIDGSDLKRLIDSITPGPLPIIINIERWSIYSDDKQTRAQDRAKFLKVIEQLRTARPGIRLGYYDVAPTRSYWPLVDSSRKKDKEKWEQLNQKALDDFIPYVDAIFPSLYTLYADKKGWQTYAEETLRITSGFGKPVYCFLWPQYNIGNRELAGRYLSADYWNLELETCYKYADGIVIWNFDPSKEWDPDAEWWQQTLKFMRTHSIGK